MFIIIDPSVRITVDEIGSVYVTRPSITGRVCTHRITSEYDIFAIAKWLYMRIKNRSKCPSVQFTFPLMKAEDREFLITGITPQEWNDIFPNKEDDDDTKNDESK